MLQLLLLDEPTAALDPTNSDMVFNFLSQLVQTLNITIIIITHDTQILQQYNQEPAFVISIENESRIIKPYVQ